MQEAIGQLQWRALATGVMNEPIDVDVNEAKTVANIAIPIEGNGTDATSNAGACGAPRRDRPADRRQRFPAPRSASPENTAQSKDFNDQMKTVAPLVFGFVLLFAFLLMLVSFRSIVIAAEGDRPQPALGRRRLRDPRPRLPARLGEAAARLRVHRRDRSRSCRSCCS